MQRRRILLADDNPEVFRAYTFRESFGQSSIRARLDASRSDAATELSNPEDLASTPSGA